VISVCKLQGRAQFAAKEFTAGALQSTVLTQDVLSELAALLKACAPIMRAPLVLLRHGR
jgi:hypothetical protein